MVRGTNGRKKMRQAKGIPSSKQKNIVQAKKLASVPNYERPIGPQNGLKVYDSIISTKHP